MPPDQQPPGYGPPPAQPSPPYAPPPGYGPPPAPAPGYGYGPPPGYRPPRGRGRAVWITLLVVVLVVVGALVVGHVIGAKSNEGVASDYRQVAALQPGTCFTPSTSLAGDAAIRAIESCGVPDAVVLVTGRSPQSSGCSHEQGNSTMVVYHPDHAAVDEYVCVTANVLLGHCYTNAQNPVLIAPVDCSQTAEVTLHMKTRVTDLSAADPCGQGQAFYDPFHKWITCSTLP